MTMKTVDVEYVTRERMIAIAGEDYLGVSKWGAQYGNILIRNDMSPSVTKSVLAHERWHVDHESAFEPGAWWAGFRADWRGFFGSIWLSLNASRLSLYVRRLFERF